jgi:cation-transporting P-type ATPase E
MVATDKRQRKTDGFQGLTEAEAEFRMAASGGNRVRRRSSRSYSRILGQNLFSFLNMLIVAIAASLAILGQYVDALITASLAATNVSVATIQEIRAKRQLDKIALLTRPVAHVLREGREREIDVEQIVQGDLLILRPGDQVAVDGKVVSSGYVSMDESLLSGESEPVPKRRGEDIFSGSFCMTGAAVYEAAAIGADSMAERLSAEARKFRNVRTPLQTEMTWMMRFLLIVLLLLSVQVVFTIDQIYDRFPMQEAARAGSVIVGLVPQGLVLMVVVTYAMAIVRLAGRGALVQRMNAVESLSHVDTLCLDKTGTITSNNLQLEAIIPLGTSEQEVRGALGDFVSSASSGNRTTEALVQELPGRVLEVLSELPFSSTHKWSGIAFNTPEREGSYLLGAPEVFSRHVPDYHEAEPKLAEATAQGKRALLFVHSPSSVDLGTEEQPRMPDNLRALAIVILSDELRADAEATIRRFAEAGIWIKVISGDNPETVAALARQAGIKVDEERGVVSGAELEQLSDTAFDEVAVKATVFGRVNPDQKERLINALKQDRRYVAMIGDGVNDVLALKKANVAIAMRTGSEVTRSVADLVLIDDSFAVLPDTFREGQRVRNGMKYSMELFLTRTFYTMIVIYITALMGESFPVALRHGALVAALTVGIPAFALAIWAQPGHTPRRLLPEVFRVVIPAALTIGVLLLIIYRFFLTLTGEVVEAQTALTVASMLAGLTFMVFLRPPSSAWVAAHERARDRRPFMLALGMLALYTIISIVPPLREFFDLRTLPVSAYLMIVTAVAGWAVTLRLIWRLKIADQVGTTLGHTWKTAIGRIHRARRLRAERR